MDVKVGQVLEFIASVEVEGRVIAQGTRVRVGHIMSEIQEPKLTLIVLGGERPGTLLLDRHFVTMNCRVVSQPA